MRTKQLTLELPIDAYEKVVAIQQQRQTRSVAEFVQEAVLEKLARVSWQHDLADLRHEIRAAGGLKLKGSREEIIERLRETRREIFEAEYAHLYR